MTLSPLNEQTRKRVSEIVAMARGDRHQAERLIRAQLERDPHFLRDLVAPFLDGIVAHALAGATPKPKSSSRGGSLSESGMDSLMRGLEGVIGGKTSQAGHADTIRALADAQARKRKDPS